MGKSGRGSTADVDARLAALDAKIAELREATRAANEALGDVKRERREIKKWLDTTFEARMAWYFRRLEGEIHEFHDNFSREVRSHCDRMQRAIANRWKYIETMTMTDQKMVSMIALHVLQEAEGPVETADVKWHLVKEEVENGKPIFGFRSSLTQRANADPEVDQAIQDALDRYAPDAANFELFTLFLDTEGPDRK